MSWFNLTPITPPEGDYGTPEADEHDCDGGAHIVQSLTSRDYPEGDSGSNFIWRMIIFPFHVFKTTTGRHEEQKIGVMVDGHAPVLGVVSTKTVDKKAAQKNDDYEGALESYERKFSNSGKTRRKRS